MAPGSSAYENYALPSEVASVILIGMLMVTSVPTVSVAHTLSGPSPSETLSTSGTDTDTSARNKIIFVALDSLVHTNLHLQKW